MFRKYVCKLLTCPHCVGFWVTWPPALLLSVQLMDAHWTIHILVAMAAVGLEDQMQYLFVWVKTQIDAAGKVR